VGRWPAGPGRRFGDWQIASQEGEPHTFCYEAIVAIWCLRGHSAYAENSFQ
jgi:hypothetical protein